MQRLIVSYFAENNLCARAVSGRQGLLQAFAGREPDLVILDLHLGEDDGLDLLRDLRIRSIVPVLIVTGHRLDELDRVFGLEVGADDYITKPFGLRELLARARAMVSGGAGVSASSSSRAGGTVQVRSGGGGSVRRG